MLGDYGAKEHRRVVIFSNTTRSTPTTFERGQSCLTSRLFHRSPDKPWLLPVYELLHRWSTLRHNLTKARPVPKGGRKGGLDDSATMTGRIANLVSKRFRALNCGQLCMSRARTRLVSLAVPRAFLASPGGRYHLDRRFMLLSRNRPLPAWCVRKEQDVAISELGTEKDLHPSTFSRYRLCCFLPLCTLPAGSCGPYKG